MGHKWERWMHSNNNTFSVKNSKIVFVGHKKLEWVKIFLQKEKKETVFYKLKS